MIPLPSNFKFHFNLIWISFHALLSSGSGARRGFVLPWGSLSQDGEESLCYQEIMARSLPLVPIWQQEHQWKFSNTKASPLLILEGLQGNHYSHRRACSKDYIFFNALHRLLTCDDHSTSRPASYLDTGSSVLQEASRGQSVEPWQSIEESVSRVSGGM